VHYEDRPSGAASEQRLVVNSRRTESSAVQERIDSRLESQAVRQEKKAAAAEEKAAAAAKEAEAEEKQKRCDTYRARLETYVQSRRLYREDEDGERVWLDDTERQDAQQKVEEQIAENCTS
jgi:vacuolar-type H+-ATPase subunit I/STV1